VQDAMDFGQPKQQGFSFPVSLVQKYRPQVKNFVGLDEVKRTMLGLLKSPRPCAILAVGPPGSGKTEMGRALCEELPASLYHMKAASCDASTMQAAWEHFQYFPGEGKRFHFGLIDEADRMTEKAQDQWLSYGDSTAGIKPSLLGGMEQGEVPPIVWFHTSNGVGPKQTDPPGALHARFVSRCMVLRFEPPAPEKIARYLRWVWEREGGPKKYPQEFFEGMAKGIAVRDALMRMDVELLAPRSAKEVKEYLAEQKRNVEEAEQRKWQEALDNAPDPNRSASAKRAWETMRTQKQNVAAISGGVA
jgi:MoxR-like ATPase